MATLRETRKNRHKDTLRKRRKHIYGNTKGNKEKWT